jgi:hypothetical protein
LYHKIGQVEAEGKKLLEIRFASTKEDGELLERARLLLKKPDPTSADVDQASLLNRTVGANQERSSQAADAKKITDGMLDIMWKRFYKLLGLLFGLPVAVAALIWIAMWVMKGFRPQRAEAS